jgi:hypothetical protein
MSISSLISPSGEPSVQDSLWHIALSTNSGQTDFKYVFDIFNGTEQLIRVKLFPDPTNGRGYFDAGPIVRNEITYDWFQPVAGYAETLDLPQPSVSGQIAVTYNVRVGEDYSGVTTLNLASGNVTAYNWSVPLFKRKQQDTSTFGNQKWFTNRPKIIKCKIDEPLFIPYRTTGSTYQFTLKTYGFNNSLINTYSATIISKISTNPYLQLNVGPEAINNSLSNLIDENVMYYTLQQGTGELLKVYVDCDPRYEGINLAFINSYGMFDTARFNLARKLTMDTERKSFEKNGLTFNNTSVGYYTNYYDVNNVYNETKINYGSKTNWSYNLTMDYPTDEEYQWLAELMVSPQIYALIDGDYYPVTIKNTNYEYSTYQNNKLKALQIDIELNQTRYGYLR